mmetsp:Transcript_43129/g.68307  ORF Transcript_43129/g.68307 Transcript_43129/m.68307 type:complete len:256 (-) Transcript_43129:364-1131(-)
MCLCHSKQELRAPSLVSQAVSNLSRLIHSLDGLVWLVHDDVDPAHGIFHHALTQLAPQLSKALKGGLSKLDGWFVLLQFSHNLDDHIDAHGLSAMLCTRRNASGADFTKGLQGLFCECQGLLWPPAVEQPASHGMCLDCFLSLHSEFPPQGQGSSTSVHRLIDFPLRAEGETCEILRFCSQEFITQLLCDVQASLRLLQHSIVHEELVVCHSCDYQCKSLELFVVDLHKNPQRLCRGFEGLLSFFSTTFVVVDLS